MFKAFFNRSGELAYQSTNLGPLIAEHIRTAGGPGCWSVHGDRRQSADLVVFEVAESAFYEEFSPYHLGSLPEGVAYVGHYWTEKTETDVLDDLDDAA